MARRKLVAGNWKMNGLRAQEAELKAVAEAAGGVEADLVLCPPATLVARFAEVAKDSTLGIGGQDCHAAAKGAHTGDVSAEMLADGVRILYGGSVKPDNARQVLSPADVDGALVGGASLKAADFLAIARAVS